MELFVSEREAGVALALTRKLKALGLRGRDAAYLASLQLPRPEDRGAVENYLSEFRFMVTEERRSEAARLIGLEDW